MKDYSPKKEEKKTATKWKKESYRIPAKKTESAIENGNSTKKTKSAKENGKLPSSSQIWETCDSLAHTRSKW